MVKSAASVPSLLHVTSPIGPPVSAGTGDVHGVFSATLASARPVIPSVALSCTSVTVNEIETIAVLPSASVAFTVTSYTLSVLASSGSS